jgi:hypothetical protein
MANKREKDLLGLMKEPMVEEASASKGVGQASSVVSQDPILDKQVGVVTAAQKCAAEKSTQPFVPQVLHGAALAAAMKEFQKLSSPAPVAGTSWECTGCTSMNPPSTTHCLISGCGVARDAVVDVEVQPVMQGGDAMVGSGSPPSADRHMYKKPKHTSTTKKNKRWQESWI